MKKMLNYSLWIFLGAFCSVFKAETFTVTSDVSKIPCQGCIKTNSFLIALEKAFQSQESCNILLEDKTYNLDSNAVKAYISGAPNRSNIFAESSLESGRDIIIKGNINQIVSELVFAEEPITIKLNKIRKKI